MLNPFPGVAIGMNGNVFKHLPCDVGLKGDLKCSLVGTQDPETAVVSLNCNIDTPPSRIEQPYFSSGARSWRDLNRVRERT